jgi:hypothetical protein
VTHAEIGRGGLGIFFAQIDDHDMRSLGGQRLGGCLADSARRGRTGDDYNLVLEQHRCLLSVDVMAQCLLHGLPHQRGTAQLCLRNFQVTGFGVRMARPDAPYG